MALNLVDDLICSALRGEHVSWPQGDSPAFADTFLRRCDDHGVTSLLHEQLRGREGWPARVLDGLQTQALARAMWELRHRHVVAELIAALTARGIHPLVFKGTALAYSHYKNPATRARGDTDVIVRPQDRITTDEVLNALGFTRNVGVEGDFISYQASYTLEQQGSGGHDIDLHWKINNSELLSKLFSHDELQSHAVRLSRLCSDAMAAGPVHALLLACMHRAVHRKSPYYVNGQAHYSADRLIWLYDIHLLASRLSLAHWHEFSNEARQKHLSCVCLNGLKRAGLCFHTPLPEFVMEALAQPGKRESAAIYLSGSKLRRTQLDFGAINGVSNKLRFLRELAFPSKAYMRHKYGPVATVWLPWLYVHRSLGGIIKRLRTTRQMT